MKPRRTLVAATLAFGLLGSGSADAVGYRMDGVKRTKASYDGVLTQSVMRVPMSTTGDPMTPERGDCTAQSCDVRDLILTLPKGTTWGKFTATVTVERTVGAALYLYDPKGEIAASDDVLLLGGWSNAGATSYDLIIDVRRMRAGRYVLALVDRAGQGAFQAKVDWVAHPPDRRKS